MKKISYGIIIFAVYNFLLTVTLQINDAAALIKPSQHYLGTFMLGLGFLLFYIGRIIFTDAGKRRISIISSVLIYIVSILIRLRGGDEFLPVLISTLTIGYLGGMAYYNLAALCSINGKSGLTISVGATIAFALQYFLQGTITNNIVIYSILVLGAAFLLLTAFFPLGDYTLNSVLPYSEETDEWRTYIKRNLILRILISLCILIVMVLCEISYVIDNSQSVNLYGITRLLIPVGYFVIGIAYDMKGFKASDFVMLFLSVFSIVAKAGSDFSTVRVGLFYLLVGATIAYITLGFWDIAPKTNHPDLWAVFGRIISITEGVIVYLLIYINNNGHFLTMFVTSAFLSIIVLLIMKENALKEPVWQVPQTEAFSPEDALVSEAVAIASTPENIFDEFSQEYRLTPREREVMYSVLHSDDKIKTIATEIGLSDRMVYRYMNQLYEKLNTENRAGLMKVYFDFESKHNR